MVLMTTMLLLSQPCQICRTITPTSDADDGLQLNTCTFTTIILGRAVGQACTSCADPNAILVLSFRQLQFGGRHAAVAQ